MIEIRENEPALLLRVVASIILDPYGQRLPPVMDVSKLEPGRILPEVDHQHPK